MDEVKFADLNDVQDFFNRSHSTSTTGTFCTEPINIKDFIGWCNNPNESISKSPDRPDEAETLGNAIVALNQLDNSELEAMESALRKGAWDDWCDTEWSKIRQAKKLKPKSTMKAHPENAAYYFALKHLTDNQKQYHFCFDKNVVAKIDAFDPFAKDKNGKQVLNQQWHVLISVLALLDVAHVLSCDHHEYHYLYPYLSSYDKGDLNKMQLKLKSSLSLKIDKVPNYSSDSMMTWIKNALVKQESE
jgi:hypothetical protein